MSNTAIIGGTGLSDLVGLADIELEEPRSNFGPLSAAIESGVIGRQRIRFLSRHGKPHSIPPHKINYRANIDALHQLGVTQIIAVNAVGSLQSTMQPRHIVIPHQLIDYTFGREHTYSDGTIDSSLEHVDFSDPYDETLRFSLINAAEQAGIAFTDSGVYACTQGPRLETAAEVERLRRDGCDIVGMTGMPEAALARELGIAYASICLVVNPAAGLSAEPITMEEIHRVLEKGMERVMLLLKSVLS